MGRTALPEPIRVSLAIGTQQAKKYNCFVFSHYAEYVSLYSEAFSALKSQCFTDLEVFDLGRADKWFLTIGFDTNGVHNHVQCALLWN